MNKSSLEEVACHVSDNESDQECENRKSILFFPLGDSHVEKELNKCVLWRLAGKITMTCAVHGESILKIFVS